METYIVIVHDAKLKAVPSSAINSYKKHAMLWKTVAKTPAEAEDRYCKFFCPQNDWYGNV